MREALVDATRAHDPDGRPRPRAVRAHAHRARPPCHGPTPGPERAGHSACGCRAADRRPRPPEPAGALRGHGRRPAGPDLPDPGDVGRRRLRAPAPGGRRRVVAERAEDELPAVRPEPRASGPAANIGCARWLDDRDGGVGRPSAPTTPWPRRTAWRRCWRRSSPGPGPAWPAPTSVTTSAPVVDRYFGPLFRPAAVEDGWEPVDYPHGTLLLARRACLEDIGLFDERYFAYCEEADLGLRARGRRWEVGLVRGARVTNPDLSSSVARRRLPPAAQHPAADPRPLRPVRRLHPLHDGRAAAGLPEPVPVPSPADLRRPRRVRALRDHLRGCYGPPPARLVGSLPPVAVVDTPRTSSSVRTEPVLIDLRTRRRSGGRLPRIPSLPTKPTAPTADRRRRSPTSPRSTGCGARRRRRAALPRRVRLGQGRLPRGLDLLHAVGLPDHHAAAGRARAAPGPSRCGRSGAAGSGA